MYVGSQSPARASVNGLEGAMQHFPEMTQGTAYTPRHIWGDWTRHLGSMMDTNQWMGAVGSPPDTDTVPQGS